MTDSTVLLNRIAALRRRAVLVRAARALAIALAAAAAIAAVAVVAGGPGVLTDRPVWVAVGLATCGLIAAIVAAARTPAARAVAFVADARMGFRERLVTGLQCLGQTDAMSQLVVDDAARHARRMDAADVFPWRVPRPAVLVLAASGLVIVVASLVPDLAVFQASRRLVQPSGRTTSIPAPPPDARVETLATDDLRLKTDDLRLKTDDLRLRTDDLQPATDDLRPKTEQLQLKTDDVGLKPADAPRQDANSSRLETRNSESEASASGPAARGAAPLSGRAEAVDDAGATSALEARAHAALARRDPAALRRAEAAIASERIPPGYREYIRRYFLAIRQ
jgi:hypothetical protein